MPTPRLAALILRLLQRRATPQQAGAFFEQGTIASVLGSGNPVVILDGGRTVTASLTTDEPFEDGDRVWVSRTESGRYIVHGGVR